MKLLSNIFSSGKSSRLYKSLVYEEQVAKSASAYTITLEKSGALFFNCIAQSGVEPAKLEAALWSEIHKLIESGVTEAELEKAKNRFITERARSLQHLAHRADTLQQAYAYTKRTETANEELTNLSAVTKEDIHSVAKKFLGSTKSVVLHTLPKGQ